MVALQGKGVYGGIAIGTAALYRRGRLEVSAEPACDPAEELARFEAAKQSALSELQGLYDKAVREVGEKDAQIFQIHQMMVEDLDYQDAVINRIQNQKASAAYAVSETSKEISGIFAAMEDEYMRERAADVRDISARLLKFLTGVSAGGLRTEGKCIVCADDLVPSETVQLDKENVLAFATAYGSANSHTAILARTMNIPAVIGLGEEFLREEFEGKTMAVDGFTGRVYLDPDEGALEELRQKQAEEERKKALLQQLKGKENRTLDGRSIQVYANIGGLDDLNAVLENDAGGIGLFRSEFLYLENSDYPNEEEQFRVYRQAAERMAGKRVIIRTLDIGADKQIGYFGLEPEENPALGYRAIRICLTRKDLFKTQLRAICRASAYGNLAILFPMIISRRELREAKALLKEAQEELRREGTAFDEKMEIGVMIETPASVIISDQLAAEADFFSVGTNDLTQYTLAADRQNPKLEPFCDPHHEAVLRMIQMAAEQAHRHGAWIGICGELGGDLELTEVFLAMGIDELSAAPGRVLPLREKIRSLDLTGREQQILDRALVCETEK